MVERLEVTADGDFPPPETPSFFIAGLRFQDLARGEHHVEAVFRDTAGGSAEPDYEELLGRAHVTGNIGFETLSVPLDTLAPGDYTVKFSYLEPRDDILRRIRWQFRVLPD